MSNRASIVEELLQEIPQLRPQMYFKTSLTALSHAMEDQVLAGSDCPLVIASFQQARFYRQEAHRYQRIANITQQVYVLSAEGAGFSSCSEFYETIAFEEADALTQEWHLVVLGDQYSACLICRERQPAPTDPRAPGALTLEQTRRFEGIWTLDLQVSQQAAEILLRRILEYRPDLTNKVEQARTQFLQTDLSEICPGLGGSDPFAQRLVTYVQAGQYKLLKAYKAISAQERRERLVNSITSAIRRSLNPSEIFKIAVQELGQALQVCRCLIYRCKAEDITIQIQHEYLTQAVSSLVGQIWPLQDNPLFQRVLLQPETIAIDDTLTEGSPYEADLKGLEALIGSWKIHSWLMAPLIYQDRLLGIIELHHCQPEPHIWSENDKALVEAIAAQLSVAIIQAEAYANLEELNRQLAALDRTRSNLIAITGHELRTPLSTIQVCLESLSSEPDMPSELRQVMLSSALADAERMRKLVQDFLILSRLESGRIEWNLEALSLWECAELALSSVKAKHVDKSLPQIAIQIPPDTPLVRADGEWLVEVLAKLLDNACKFTPAAGEITISVARAAKKQLQVTVADTGRGIEPNRLEAVFDRFYQEEGALRRTTGGTGLGLAICRQIIAGLGGQIWADSEGKDKGSQFHFLLPLAENRQGTRSQAGRSRKTARSSRKTRRSQPDNLVLE
ncbi:MAG: DICT sensory domain-containing protein [Leptolyngbyaceae cyanobacterium MO_188.B28]|nr:DICT sensory domain-containing protein [Leptolyngbyaceae cyanobacterium MO_188.B28]